MINYNEIAKRVATWNSIAGMDTEDNKALEEQIKLYVELCAEEADEGWGAVHSEGNANYIEVLDSAVDQFVVLSRLLHLLQKRGFNVEKAFEKVLDNNDSKFIDETGEVTSKGGIKVPDRIYESCKYYEEKGINIMFDFQEESNKWILFNSDTGKILKPKGFIPVNLEDCVPTDLKGE